VRFGFPFLSTLAVTGQLTGTRLERVDADGVTIAEAVRSFGLDPGRILSTAPLLSQIIAALEVHIEQGPVLDAANESLAVVEGIVGQSRLRFTFDGHANHAGTTPMRLRHDALTAAAQWICEIERFAAADEHLVATVGHIEALPGAINVIPGRVTATLDVRHPDDNVRLSAVAHMQTLAKDAAAAHRVQCTWDLLSEQATVRMDEQLTYRLQTSAQRAGYSVRSMFSGAGHDAMILAPHMPTTMLFLRSPGGVSHHPAETVHEQDVQAALDVVLEFIRALELEHGVAARDTGGTHAQ
jgi:allantoate deiminase